MRLSLLSFLFLAACAKPNYVTTVNGTGGPAEKVTTECQAHFSSRACVAINWETLPTETTVGSFVFKIFRPNLADGSPVALDLPGDIGVILWMPRMGHGSAPVKLERLDVGTYRATQASFFMKGEWEIHFQLKVRDDVKDQAILPFSL